MGAVDDGLRAEGGGKGTDWAVWKRGRFAFVIVFCFVFCFVFWFRGLVWFWFRLKGVARFFFRLRSVLNRTVGRA